MGQQESSPIGEELLSLAAPLWCCTRSLIEPAVKVTSVSARTAVVQWDFFQAFSAKKYRIEVNLLPSPCGAVNLGDPPVQVAFFEVDGQACSFELPVGTLDRACGPYMVRITVESAAESFSLGSETGMSEPFSTPPELPGAVVGLRLAGQPAERECCVQWGAPEDDGGSPVEEYEVSLFPRRLLPESGPVLTAGTRACTYTFSCLSPGGEYIAEVRARSAAELLGPAGLLEVSMPVGTPSAPSSLRARLLPWRCREAGLAAAGEGVADAFHPRVCVEEADVDRVRLEFTGPLEDGGRPLQSFLVYASEGEGEDADSGDSMSSEATSDGTTGEKGAAADKLGQSQFLLCTVSAAMAAGPSGLGPGCPCTCDVAVPPYNVYLLTVSASNGAFTSSLAEPAPSVYVPPRLPPAPPASPEVLSIDGALAVELRWPGASTGGGLPITSYEVCVLRPSDPDGELSLQDVERQVSIPASEAVPLAFGWWPRPGAETGQTQCAMRIDGLEAGERYRFALAASNWLGAGSWSEPSSPVRIPAASAMRALLGRWAERRPTPRQRVPSDDAAQGERPDSPDDDSASSGELTESGLLEVHGKACIPATATFRTLLGRWSERGVRDVATEHVVKAGGGGVGAGGGDLSESSVTEVPVEAGPVCSMRGLMQAAACPTGPSRTAPAPAAADAWVEPSHARATGDPVALQELYTTADHEQIGDIVEA